MPSREQMERWRGLKAMADAGDSWTAEGVTAALDFCYEAHDAVPALCDMLERAMELLEPRIAQPWSWYDERNALLREWRGGDDAES